MASSALTDIFEDPGRSQTLALTLGALGAPLVAVGIAIESSPLAILGAVTLAASGAVWAVRGIKEDKVAARAEES